MNARQPLLPRILKGLSVRPRWTAVLALLALFAAGCHLTQEQKGRSVLSFDRLYDSLSQYDTAVIVLKTQSGETIDVLFRDKVDSPSDLEKLKAPNWDGGMVVVSIAGIKDGVVVSQVETLFDPSDASHDQVVVVVAPEASLRSAVTALTLLAGDSLSLPPVTVHPENLLDKSLDWQADPSGLLALGPDHLKALKAGTGTLTARLRKQPSVTLTIAVTVGASGQVPESLSVEPDSLEVPEDGAPELLSATVFPSAAPSAVLWSSEDTSVATVDTAGRVSGKGRGVTRVWAASRVRPSVRASARVKVTGPIPVESIAFAFDSLELLVGRPAENLVVVVRPPGANPGVTFTVSDPAKAAIENGGISGVAAGRISVYAVSVANPAAKDTLIVKIAVPTQTDTVPPAAPVVRVNPAGPTRNRRPSWSWAGGGGGAGSFQILLDKSVFDAGAAAVTDTAFRPASDLAPGVHVLYVRERDAAGNWSLPGSAQVEIDTTGPAAPRIVGTSPTSSLPRWTWSSGGNGGSGVYRSRLGDAAFPADATGSKDSAYALTAATSGTTYTLYVQERDAAGNWSPAASLAIKYDLTRPTVAFTAPQASGTFITGKDTVTVKGTASGLNGIATLEYTLNGGAANPVTPGAGGSWSLNALTVPNARTTVVKVTATDSLGNKGEAEITILRDSDPPTAPTSLSVPASPTNVRTLTWTWAEGEDGAAGSGLSGRYRWRLGTAAWTEVTSPTAVGVTLAEGANAFQVQEQDRAGNWSASATSNVVLDTRPPDAVTFAGIDSSYTASATPTWSWTPSSTNGGIAEYVVKLGSNPEFVSTTTSFVPTSALADNTIHTLTVRQRDQVPGVLGAARSFSFRVKVNPPAAPVVRSAAGTAANLVTNNPGFSWTSGGGGNGTYRVFVNTETTPRVTGVTQTTWSLPANAADGPYTIRVQEQDGLGRWGTEGSFSIALDRTGPQYTNVRISGKTWALREGFITNAASLVIGYQADGTARTFTCALTRNNASNPCTTSNVDALGNRTTLTRNIWRRSNVVFFTVAGAGTRDGSSWEDAANDIQAEIERAGSEGKEFWLATGNYNQGLTMWAPKWLYMHGGLQAANFPVDTTNRILAGSTLNSLSMMGTTPGGAFTNVRFSGGAGLGGGDADSPLYFDNCVFKGHLEILFGANNHMRNSEISGVNITPTIRIAQSSKVVWEGGKITGNISDDYVIQVGSVDTLTFRGTVDMSSNSTQGTAMIENYGRLRIQGTVRATTSTNVTCGSAYITARSGSTCGN